MRTWIGTLLAALLLAPAAAQSPDMSAFKTGPVFEGFGPHASVEGANALPADASFAIAFDVAKKAEEGPEGTGARNRGFESAARFINMHVAAGVPAERIKLVVVVHGRAVRDVVPGEGNGSEAMVRAMIEHGVRFVVCGQSAAANGIKAGELIEGVEMELSAMTAHALLQQSGYTVNPF